MRNKVPLVVTELAVPVVQVGREVTRGGPWSVTETGHKQGGGISTHISSAVQNDACDFL